MSAATTTTTDRIIIALTEDEAKGLCGRSNYKDTILFFGDVPGHLSNANLKGNAKKWAGTYSAQRDALKGAVRARFGVVAAPIAAHRGVVWAKEVEGGFVPVEFVRA